MHKKTEIKKYFFIYVFFYCKLTYNIITDLASNIKTIDYFYLPLDLLINLFKDNINHFFLNNYLMI